MINEMLQYSAIWQHYSDVVLLITLCNIVKQLIYIMGAKLK